MEMPLEMYRLANLLEVVDRAGFNLDALGDCDLADFPERPDNGLPDGPGIHNIIWN